MDKDNVIPFRPTPNHVTDAEFVSPWYDYAVQLMHADAARLMSAETIFHDPVTDELNRLERAGLEAYEDCNGKTCYREAGEGERLRHENRMKRLAEVRREEEAIRKEVHERWLTEIDPDWRDRFTLEAAERFYWQELAAKRKPLLVLDRAEKQALRDAEQIRIMADDSVDFDDGLVPEDARRD